MSIKNLGKDVDIIENKNGGKQSKIDYAFNLLDPHAMFALSAVLEYGASRYSRDNWRLISVEEHLNHALTHIFAYMANDEQDDHLEHALCRLHMAVAKKIRPNYLGYAEKDGK